MAATPYSGTIPVIAPKGTGLYPSYTFVNDYGTGVYSPGPGQIAITSGGSDRVVIGPSGVSFSSGGTFGGNVSLQSASEFRLYDTDNSNYVGFKAPGTITANRTWTLPAADGSASQALVTDGSGTLSWSTVLSGTGLVPADGAVVIGNGTSFVTESGSTARTSLGLSIGVDVQPYDAATAKTNITQVFTAGQRGEVTTLTSSATITPDFAASNHFAVTLTQSTTLANPVNLVAGQSGVIWFTQDGTGGRTVSFGTFWDFANGGVAPSVTLTANARSALVYAVQSATQITATLLANLV